MNPFIARRGIKFNIPLDARTPSYSDDSTSGQANIPEMWDMAFWTRFLDEMARHRYNVLSLWSLSPFPSLVKVPEYPNVALADVKRKTGAMFDATNQGRNMYDPSWPLETVRTMTIDEKIAFWRGVMQYARDRGIDVSVFTWNIFVYGTEGSGYGLTVDPRNATTKDYVRKSTRALFNTYPLLTAIGVTSGENMGDLDDAGKEQWMWETYGLGVKDAMADAADPASPFHRPGRHITLIHRAHQADLKAIVETFKALPGSDRSGADSTLAFSFKYLAGAHAQLDGAAVHVPERLVRLDAGRQADLADGPQRRLLLPALGRSRLRPRLLDAAPAAAEDRRLHARARRLHLGPRLRQHAGRDAAAAGHREAVVLVHALGPAGLRAGDARTSASRRRSRRVSRRPVRRSSAGWRRPPKIVPLAEPLLLGLLRFPVVSRRLVEPGRLRRRARAHRPEVPADARGRGRRDAARSCR